MIQATAPARAPRRSAGLWAFRAIVAICYVIYIAVSLFHTENFLFGLDALLGVALLYAITSRAFALYTMQHGYLLLLLAIYTGTVLFAWLGLSRVSEMNSLVTLRNLLYCVAVFVVALTYVTTRERLSMLIRLIAILTVLSALYGVRQAIFGYWRFELDRMALMGASLKEMLILGRARLSATFGDPLLCGFFMMLGIFIIRARLSLSVVSKRVRWFYVFGAILAFVVLVASLTRAPLLGFVVGTIAGLIVDFHLTRRSVARIVWVLVSMLAFAGVVVWAFESGWLANATNPILKVVNAGVSSAWSLVALFFGGGQDQYFLVSQSKDMRIIAWTEGLAFLKLHPLGAGFSDLSVFSFALGDTGLLQIALLTGIPGALSFVAILLTVFLRGATQARRTKRPADRRLIAALIGAWAGFIVTTSISNMATSSVASVVVWLIAAVLVNAKRIFREPPDARPVT